MSEALMLSLEELMAKRAGSVDPSKFPDEQFDLYSIPAFDKGGHEVVAGSEIGSTKQVVQPNDVLLSKIVPHIRRSWVVGQNNGRRMIASGEWIVFRSDKADPAYLRHVLVGDPFHAQFMQTVSGVGGSLLRARPAQVAKIKIPLPPLPEQRRIAAILDQADALRAKRREALAQLDSLTQSIFMEMFGDSGSFPTTTLESLCELITDGTHQTPTYADTGTIFLSAKNVTSGKIDWDNIKYIPESLHLELHRRLAPKRNDILLAKNGTTGVAALVDRDCIFDVYVSLALLRPRLSVVPKYLLGAINSPICKKQFNESLKGIGVPNLHLKEIRATKVPAPPTDLQEEFAHRMSAVEHQRLACESSLVELDSLFASLQHRAFRGEL